ncbi:MAG: ATP-binding protein [Candidatus Omnitrophica bacterium]|nr:ATP-binding protein [Candidatus Omnitrophota bacterium]MCM8827592.1 ATP-binding protein [Candidatus Omnitrophota bacterium]
MEKEYRIVVPSILNPNSLEYFLSQFPQDIKNTTIILDFNLVTSISSYCIICLLILCRYLNKLCSSVEIDFYDNYRMFEVFKAWDFFPYFEKYRFNERNCQKEDNLGEEEIYLQILPIEKAGDIYRAVDSLRKRLELNLEQSTDLFVIISEIGQNIIEHSNSCGFISVGRICQRRKDILKICIADEGIGIGVSLREKLSKVYNEYLDGIAIYKAMFEGISRYDDIGRGNGIIKTKGIVEEHKGKICIRSGIAKLWGDIPSWAIEGFLRKKLSYLPGTQVNINFSLS